MSTSSGASQSCQLADLVAETKTILGTFARGGLKRVKFSLLGLEMRICADVKENPKGHKRL